MNSSFIGSFYDLLAEKTLNIFKNIIGDPGYQPKNNFMYLKKKAILRYLKSKCIVISQQLKQQKKKKYTDYDLSLLEQPITSMQQLRELILKLKKDIDAAEDSLKQVNMFQDEVRVNFLNESAFEFDRQRWVSMSWGLILASFINSVIYKRGSVIRRAALFLTCGHVMGQVSYHSSLDRYFDSVYSIFQEEALKFIAEQKQSEEMQKTVRESIQGKIIKVME